MLTSWADGSSPLHAIRIGAAWAMDNFAFTGFDGDRFQQSLDRFVGMPGCLFVVAPDVWSDARATALLFDEWYDPIKSKGYPIALAAQNGIERMSIPWGAIDAVFVGGDDKFKYSEFVAELVIEAHARRKWAHMGRVNSRGRWRYCKHAGFDSTDGTGMVIERGRVLEALAVLNSPERPAFDWRPRVEVS